MAELFPYPSEDPDELRRLLEGFRMVVGNHDVESEPEASADTGYLASVVAATAEKAYEAFESLVSAVERARADVDEIRLEYDREFDDLDASVRDINAEADPQVRLEMLRTRISAWTESAGLIHRSYRQILGSLNDAAEPVVRTLEVIDRKCIHDISPAFV